MLVLVLNSGPTAVNMHDATAETWWQNSEHHARLWREVVREIHCFVFTANIKLELQTKRSFNSIMLLMNEFKVEKRGIHLAAPKEKTADWGWEDHPVSLLSQSDFWE